MITSISLPAIVGAAVIDSINPCAFAVLIFLMTYLLALKLKNKVLIVGLVYIVTVYIVYFLAGLGLLSVLASTKITVTIYYLAGGLVMLLGFINLKDVLLKKEATLKIPESKKAVIEKWVKKTSIPAAIVLGFLVSAFELPCTGGIYLAILSILGRDGMTAKPIIYLLIYNLFFILPLVIIWLIIYFGNTSEQITAWYKRNKNSLRLIMGVGMIILGGLMIGGVI
ncbi:TPA: hypothetical protein DF272_00140 [Candidatus Falkowbacteria bacterium]|nr:hypothetical protein [Candidatus Falkowbacteria bacterium]